MFYGCKLPLRTRLRILVAVSSRHTLRPLSSRLRALTQVSADVYTGQRRTWMRPPVWQWALCRATFAAVSFQRQRCVSHRNLRHRLCGIYYPEIRPEMRVRVAACQGRNINPANVTVAPIDCISGEDIIQCNASRNVNWCEFILLRERQIS